VSEGVSKRLDIYMVEARRGGAACLLADYISGRGAPQQAQYIAGLS
jgi:hypothetical protein